MVSIRLRLGDLARRGQAATGWSLPRSAAYSGVIIGSSWLELVA